MFEYTVIEDPAKLDEALNTRKRYTNYDALLEEFCKKNIPAISLEWRKLGYKNSTVLMQGIKRATIKNKKDSHIHAVTRGEYVYLYDDILLNKLQKGEPK